MVKRQNRQLVPSAKAREAPRLLISQLKKLQPLIYKKVGAKLYRKLSLQHYIHKTFIFSIEAVRDCRIIL